MKAKDFTDVLRTTRKFELTMPWETSDCRKSHIRGLSTSADNDKMKFLNNEHFLQSFYGNNYYDAFHRVTINKVKHIEIIRNSGSAL